MTSLLIDNPNEPPSALEATPLEEVLQSVEPAAVLLPPWLLQNVIAVDRGRGRSPFSVAHRKIHVIAREHLLAMATAQRWSLPEPLPQAQTLILLARPETDWLAARNPPQALRHYWQLLFHARIDVELRRKLQEPAYNDAAIQQRIERVGRSAFNEACFVLHRERCVPMNADNREVYAEFAAVYLELHHFRPDLLPIYFPAIADAAGVLALLREDVDGEALFRQTHLPGSAEAQAQAIQQDIGATSLVPTQFPAAIAHDARRIVQLQVRADRAASLGNHVRAAILRRRIFLASREEPATPRPTCAIWMRW